MSTRVSPLERIRADIDDLFASERDLGEVLEEVARLGVRRSCRSPSRPKSPSPWAGSATPTVSVPVLAAWGMTTEGRPALVGPEPGASESTDAWRDFLDGMVARGLRGPLLVVSDGAPGLIAAVELVFPHSRDNAV